MAAPDLEALFDFETNFELAAQSFIESELNVSTSMLYRSLEQDDYILPRIRIRLNLGEALDPPGKRFDDLGNLAYVKYSAEIEFTVQTDATEAASEVEHRSLRAKLRAAMEIEALNFSKTIDGEPILPYYQVTYIRPTGTETDTDGDIIESVLTYQMFFNIKDDAWPEDDEEEDP